MLGRNCDHIIYINVPQAYDQFLWQLYQIGFIKILMGLALTPMYHQCITNAVGLLHCISVVLIKILKTLGARGYLPSRPMVSSL